MGVFASGRLVVNPDFAGEAARTTSWCSCWPTSCFTWPCGPTTGRGAATRSSSTTPTTTSSTTSCATSWLQPRSPPAASTCPAPATMSAEEILLEMRQARTRCVLAHGSLGGLGRDAGGGRSPRPGSAASGSGGDVLDAPRERELFPGRQPTDQAEARPCDQASLPSARLARGKAMAGAARPRHRRRRARSRTVAALRGLYRAALGAGARSAGSKSVAPGERTFARAVAPRRRSQRRRPARPQARGLDAQRRPRHQRLDDRRDSAALGAIADFCDAVGVDQIRLVQCDTAVTSDECCRPAELAELRDQRLRRQRPVAGPA